MNATMLRLLTPWFCCTAVGRSRSRALARRVGLRAALSGGASQLALCSVRAWPTLIDSSTPFCLIGAAPSSS